VFGWSRGYVAFAFDGDGSEGSSPRHLLASASKDGLHWSAPTAAAMPKSVWEEGIGYTTVQFASLLEGPSGLVAVGTNSGGTCAPATTYDALWSSRDGVTWRPVTLPRGWTESIVPVVDGGSTGYIAGALDSNRLRRLWVSRDGRTWSALRMPTSSRGRIELADATSFAGGYVLVGAFIQGGCGGPYPVLPSVWWSTNGHWWARIPLGPARHGANLRITVTRLSDREVAVLVQDGTTRQAWVSTDGRRWTRTATAHSRLDWCLLSNRQRSLCVDVLKIGRPTLESIGPDLTLRPIGQRG
jgi:hypothetical protein